MIAIYSNSKVFGGVEILIFRYSEYLIKNGIPFYVIESKSTKLASLLDEQYIVEPEDVFNVCRQTEYLLLPNICKFNVSSFDFKVFEDVKFCGWLVHPNEAFQTFFPYSGGILRFFGYKASKFQSEIFSTHYGLLNEFFCKILTAGSLMIMDGACSRTFKYFYPKIALDGVRVQIPVVVDEGFDSKIDGTKLSVGYLGRLDGFKYSALKPLIINTLSKLGNVELHIVGDGIKLIELTKLCEMHGIKLTCYGFQHNYEARKILKQNTNVCVAMGTAALDLAAIRLPCIIIDPALKEHANNQKYFRFVHEMEDYTLGEYRDSPYYKKGLRSFEECLEMVDEKLVEREYQYVINNHDPDTVYQTVTETLFSSTIKIRDIEPLLNKIHSSTQRLNSIRTFYRKIANFLGK